MLAHCSPSSEWVPGASTGGMKVARKGTGHPTSLTGTPLRTKVYGITLILLFYKRFRFQVSNSFTQSLPAVYDASFAIFEVSDTLWFGHFWPMRETKQKV